MRKSECWRHKQQFTDDGPPPGSEEVYCSRAAFCLLLGMGAHACELEFFPFLFLLGGCLLALIDRRTYMYPSPGQSCAAVHGPKRLDFQNNGEVNAWPIAECGGGRAAKGVIVCTSSHVLRRRSQPGRAAIEPQTEFKVSMNDLQLLSTTPITGAGRLEAPVKKSARDRACQSAARHNQGRSKHGLAA